jgi:hypothetical protein
MRQKLAMRHYLACGLLAIILAAALGKGAQAQDASLCPSFQKNADGSWSAMRNVGVPGAGRVFHVQEGAQFRPGMSFMGQDLAVQLDRDCPAEAAAAVAPPQVELPKLADPVTGFIDSEKLTCGQLASAYQEDADFLLIWYSGLHTGQANKRMIDVAKVKAGIHNVITYCKANKDKLVSQAVDLVMK